MPQDIAGLQAMVQQLMAEMALARSDNHSLLKQLADKQSELENIRRRQTRPQGDAAPLPAPPRASLPQPQPVAGAKELQEGIRTSLKTLRAANVSEVNVGMETQLVEAARKLQVAADVCASTPAPGGDEDLQALLEQRCTEAQGEALRLVTAARTILDAYTRAIHQRRGCASLRMPPPQTRTHTH